MDGALQNLIFCNQSICLCTDFTSAGLKSDEHNVYGLVKPWGCEAVGAATSQFPSDLNSHLGRVCWHCFCFINPAMHIVSRIKIAIHGVCLPEVFHHL
jgi:hypothetical protein